MFWFHQKILRPIFVIGRYIQRVLLLAYTQWEGAFNVYFYLCTPYGKVRSTCTFICVHPMGRCVQRVLLFVYTLWEGASTCTFTCVHPMGRCVQRVLLFVYTLWEGTFNVYIY